ncbi:hypothetical protein C5B85_00110 [Pseudoclavibacter sp. AY1F1]|uniref:HAAS signaling domain-containing protein n=1 Tax=Pseudoclavibacter sp. AY1F1 TaxID=2080583 RepID=UPI000CE86EC9|nr:hypothetical protein [Pseudoclavibacter sp. AY1F1]PPF46738.1 hypothetical protein C5B85_00110 [Pseudoclavibacter sp. AY1F1]
MKPFESQNEVALGYLRELDAALADTPKYLQAEILSDIADDLRGLDEGATRIRLTELGDPRVIAAAAREEAAPPATTETPRGYAIVTLVVLVAGWYLVPVLGWIAGLVMIASGAHWQGKVRRNGILASVAVIVVSTLGLLVFRGSDAWLVGLVIFAAGPLIGNIFVADYLRRNWAAATT